MSEAIVIKLTFCHLDTILTLVHMAATTVSSDPAADNTLHNLAEKARLALKQNSETHYRGMHIRDERHKPFDDYWESFRRRMGATDRARRMEKEIDTMEQAWNKAKTTMLE